MAGSFRIRRLSWMAVLALLSLPGSVSAQTCARTITADVVAFDQVWFWNRLGAVQPQGMMYALRRDVLPISGTTLSPGNVKLRPDKRARPMVLRMNVGDCLRITFQNLLSPVRVDDDQSNTRWASIHAVGMELAGSTLDDGSWVGANPNGQVNVGQSAIYTLSAEREGEHVIQSLGAVAGGEGDGGHVNSGLFGAIIVEPAGARWYRSQLTRAEFDQAKTGTTANGFPILNYEAIYPVGHPRAGTPILNMLSGNQILHTDLTAIIAGSPPNGGGTRPGWFPEGAFPPNIFIHPERNQPFREFTILYHDEIGAVQAFPHFEDAVLSHTLHSGRDAFAINYGTGGIGAEVLANRLKVGPMHNCVECMFEEFFLASWVVGDPAMIVDVPANSPCTVANVQSGNIGACTPTPGRKATKAFFPDDPSNVYHSYLRDHVRFRVLHAGSKEHHIHHLHAHQWLYSADSDKSSYLDSQAIGPGASFTAEIAHQGGGNSNLTVGDSIFHCHFYPHFAQGMWSLWRVHDVLEEGTPIDSAGRPLAGQRALPDGEIFAGTPIPGVVPLPGKPMAPIPARVSIGNGQIQIAGPGNPGYPFFVPAQAGHRPPKPPLDTIDDGGLPRHIITAGTFVEAHTRLDFGKELITAQAQGIPEAGNTVEQAAMAFHAQASHGTCTPAGVCDGATPVRFATNGRPPIAGAPYADPCPVRPSGSPRYDRLYKVADIQDDMKINKKGWHFPQQRFSSLWDDVDDFLFSDKPPEPLFFRTNSNECVEYWLTNLVPKEYNLDDFQVRTPTDVLGQHIHLVKFDVTASDGAANGFNYEDGAFGPEEVRARVAAIRAFNGCTATDARNNTITCPLARLHPFAPFQREEWRGAQTNVQRWCADKVQDNAGVDRTLRTVFTHDHFGPSTHQQVGLYAGLVVEPTGSTWYHNETGALLGNNAGRSSLDGGPTSWQAVIDPPNQEPDYREFMIEFGDFQLAYEEDSQPCRFDAGFGAIRCDDPDDAVNPPGRKEIGLPDLLARPVSCPCHCPGGASTCSQCSASIPPPCPELVSADDPGTMSVNYRQEPVALRVRDPLTNSQAAGNAGDLSFAFSTLTRADTALNVQPAFYAPLTLDVKPKDPYTPLLRAYDNDRIQIRVLVGAHEEGHNFSVQGIKWLFEPSDTNSGYRNSQMMGISEHFEFIVPKLVKNTAGDFVDRLWSAGSSTDDYWNGIWGLFRSYEKIRADLKPLPDNPRSQSGLPPEVIAQFEHSCPISAPLRSYEVTAITAQQALPNGRLVYNARTDGGFGPLFDPTAILYVRSSDLDASLKLKPGVPVEPLVLRARAGECVEVIVNNMLPNAAGLLDLDGFNTLPMIVPNFNANDIKPSNKVGLHAQMLYHDPSRDDGANIGNNPVQTLAPGIRDRFKWYAGDITINANGTVTTTPIELGATNLISSDRIEHASKGAVGSLIIEPADATWVEDAATRHAATVTSPTAVDSPFREFVVHFQNDVNMRTGEGNGEPVQNLAGMEDPEDTGQKAINYRTEPLWKRMQHPAETPFELTDDFADWFDVLANVKVGANPQTPIFTVIRGQGVRFRVLQAGGHSRNVVFAVHGHQWDKEPYIQDSRRLGRNPLSFWEGARLGHGPTNHFDVLLRNGAGGKFQIPGDYLFRDQAGIGLDSGLWGILRVLP
ncbi:MAG TPA: copper oxidase [Thermoanaerobaculia bacterium]|nr:copper oxidase [Thermoanaerobaculia bacterium]